MDKKADYVLTRSKTGRPPECASQNFRSNSMHGVVNTNLHTVVEPISVRTRSKTVPNLTTPTTPNSEHSPKLPSSISSEKPTELQLKRKQTPVSGSSRRKRRRRGGSPLPGTSQDDIHYRRSRKQTAVTGTCASTRGVSVGMAEASTSRKEEHDVNHIQSMLERQGFGSIMLGTLGGRLLNRSQSTGSSAKLNNLLQGLESADEGSQLSALYELNNILVMGNEDTLAGFQVKQYVPVLANFLKVDSNMEITLQASRSISYILDVLPRSSPVVVQVIPVLLEKLKVIQCIDVAETSLISLEALSRKHAKSILHLGGVDACLSYLEFFGHIAQFNALQVVANCCHCISPDNFSFIAAAIPVFTNRLNSHDKKVVNCCMTGISHLIDSLQSRRDLLILLCGDRLFPVMVSLFNASPQLLTPDSLTGALRSLAVLCSRCPSMTQQLIFANIGATLRSLLTSNGEDLLPRSPFEMYELVHFISELFPKLPADGIFSMDAILWFDPTASQDGMWTWLDERGTTHAYHPLDCRIIEAAHDAGEDQVLLSIFGMNYTVDFNHMVQINGETNQTRAVIRKLDAKSLNHRRTPQPDDPRAIFYRSDKDGSSREGVELIRNLLPILFLVYSQSAGPLVRHSSLRAISRSVYVTSTDLLREVLCCLPVSGQLSHMLSSNDVKLQIYAFQLATLLIDKLPDMYQENFVRDGVMHQIVRLASKPASARRKIPVSADSSPASTPIHTPSTSHDRSKRFRRAIAGRGPKTRSQSNTEENSTDKKPLSSSNPGLFTKSSFLSNFNPVRWGRKSNSNSPGTSKLKSSPANMPSPSSNATNEKLCTWLTDQARSFQQRHFALQSHGQSHPALRTLLDLGAAAESLEMHVDHRFAALVQVANIVHGTDVTAFEIHQSGLVSNLLKYLTHDGNLGGLSLKARIMSFVQVFLGCPDHNDKAYGMQCHLNETYFRSLVSKLVICISQLEQFPVKVHEINSKVLLKSGSVTAQTTGNMNVLNFLSSHQLKCQLTRHPSCSKSRQWKGGPVYVDPLANIQSVERYLVSRGYGALRISDLNASSEDEFSDEDLEASMMEGSHYRLELYIGDHLLPRNMTAYQAIRQFSTANSDESTDDESSVGLFSNTKIWTQVHTMSYKIGSPERNGELVPSRCSKACSLIQSSLCQESTEAWPDPLKLHNHNILLNALSTVTVSPMFSDPSLEVLKLLKTLNLINSMWCCVYRYMLPQTVLEPTDFVSLKLQAKATRQLRDPWVVGTGNLPVWLIQVAQSFPFLFSFETRQLLMYATAFDRERALLRLQSESPESISSINNHVGTRLERRKRTVNRDKLLAQGETIFNELNPISRSILDINFQGEEGTGLGPSLEFYALISKELQLSDLDLWGGDSVVVDNVYGSDAGNSVSYMFSSCGLFPKVIGRTSSAERINYLCGKFRFIGRLLAKSFMDFRLLDLPLSRLVYVWLLGKEECLGVDDLRYIDPSLHKSMVDLHQIVATGDRCYGQGDVRSNGRSLCCSCVERDLDLMFVLPGEEALELCENGAQTSVNCTNLEDYVQLCVHWMLVEGVRKQMEALREGFASIIPLAHLNLFSASELDKLFCGGSPGDDKWDYKFLELWTRPDHGYTLDSCSISNLFEIMLEYNVQERKSFLQFVTGSPRLPIGGLRSLNPPLTIVKKSYSADECSDNFLPSVMTCVNYLKLPDYSSKAVLRKRLAVAMAEGLLHFNLS